jgi:hypothetical protein
MNPWAPPAAKIGSADWGHTSAPWVRAAVWSIATAAGYALLVGFVFALEKGEAFEQFSALKLLARVAEVAFLRAFGPGIALMATGLATTVVFHRWGRRRNGGEFILHVRDAWLVGAAVPGAFVLAVPFGLLGAAIACAAHGEHPSEYASTLREHWIWLDAAFGASLAAIYGLLLAAIAPFAAGRIAAGKRGLALKVLVTWVVLQIAALVASAGLGKVFAG